MNGDFSHLPDRPACRVRAPGDDLTKHVPPGTKQMLSVRAVGTRR